MLWMITKSLIWTFYFWLSHRCSVRCVVVKKRSLQFWQLYCCRFVWCLLRCCWIADLVWNILMHSAHLNWLPSSSWASESASARDLTSVEVRLMFLRPRAAFNLSHFCLKSNATFKLFMHARQMNDVKWRSRCITWEISTTIICLVIKVGENYNLATTHRITVLTLASTNFLNLYRIRADSSLNFNEIKSAVGNRQTPHLFAIVNGFWILLKFSQSFSWIA